MKKYNILDTLMVLILVLVLAVALTGCGNVAAGDILSDPTVTVGGLTPGQIVADLIAAVVTDIQNTVSRDIPPQDLAAFYRTLRVLAGRFRDLEKSNDIQEVIDQWLYS